MPKVAAYKLLAIQEGISNSKAKSLIDRGLVYARGQKIKIARGEIDTTTTFKITEVGKVEKIFEDDKIIAINKPVAMTSEELVKKFKGATLLHRLDRDTSGVILLTKDEEFRLKAIEEFRHKRVYKEYSALVHGVVSEPFTIDQPIMTDKDKKALSRVHKNGQEAITHVTPLEVMGRRSKVQVVIETGRTHQIRLHLSHAGHPIMGDELYGKGAERKRLFLHAKKIRIFDYEFEAQEEKDFRLLSD
jgi:23S rRNA pseudouridine1911/1915/1917 synthase